MRRFTPLLLALWLALGAGSGTISCSSQTTTTRTVEHPGNSDTTTETTTTEEQETHGPEVGIISGTIHAIGYVLSLPFRIVGGLISIIF